MFIPSSLPRQSQETSDRPKNYIYSVYTPCILLTTTVISIVSRETTRGMQTTLTLLFLLLLLLLLLLRLPWPLPSLTTVTHPSSHLLLYVHRVRSVPLATSTSIRRSSFREHPLPAGKRVRGVPVSSISIYPALISYCTVLYPARILYSTVYHSILCITVRDYNMHRTPYYNTAGDYGISQYCMYCTYIRQPPDFEAITPMSSPPGPPPIDRFTLAPGCPRPPSSPRPPSPYILYSSNRATWDDIQYSIREYTNVLKVVEANKGEFGTGRGRVE